MNIDEERMLSHSTGLTTRALALAHTRTPSLRQYCSRRLRSLYKQLKLLHGKGRYQKRKIEPEMMADSR
jgi:hypothetical protein